MSHIDDFLADEERTVEQTKEILISWDARLSDALEDAAGLHRTFRHAYDASYDQEQSEINECGQILGMRDIDELDALAYSESIDGHPKSATVRRAREALDRSWSTNARGILLSMIGRSYMWALADLHRRRITPVLGHQRVQVEAAAIAMILLEQPAVAKEWINLYEEGKRFHRTHQARIGELLRTFGLSVAYDTGSGVALHARAAGVAHGLVQRVVSKPGRQVHEVAVLPDEYDPSQPHVFLNHALFLIRVQERIFGMLRFALPEVTDPVLLNGRLPRFARLVDDLFENFARSFPEVVHRWRRRWQGG